LQAAKDCFYGQDFACAIENALVVRSLAPEDPEAGQLLAAAQQAQMETEQEQLVSSRLADAEACFAAADYACAGSRLRTLLDLVPGQAQAILLLQRVDREIARPRRDASSPAARSAGAESGQCHPRRGGR
jgi:hypothetical protein